MMVATPNRIKLALTPTPFYLLERISELLDQEIWIKRDDMTGSVLSGNKVRKLEFTLAKALSEGADTIITCGGLQSNHCRATAFACAQLGLKCCLVLRGEPVGPMDGNLLMDHLAGATIRTYPVREYAANLDQLMDSWADELRSEGRQPFLIPTGASDGTGLWGYFNAAGELKQDFDENHLEPTAIVTATGSGGTQAGLTVGASILQLACPVIGFAVCDNEAYFQRKVSKDIEEWRREYQLEVPEKYDIQVNDAYIGPGYAKAERPVFEAIKLLAELEGILLDPVYTGKAFYGLIEEVKRGKLIGPLVFVHTGGHYGVFPYKSQWTNS